VTTSNPEDNWVVTQTGTEQVTIGRRRILAGRVPNVLGMSAQDAVFLLENAGLDVRLVGRGMIKKQSLAPGTPITNQERIILELS